MSLHRLLLALVVASLLPIAILNVSQSVGLRDERARQVAEEARGLLTMIDGEQARVIEGVRNALAILRRTRSLQDADDDACRRLMPGLRAELPAHLDVFALDGKGRVRCATDPTAVGIDASERLHVRAALDGTEFFVGPRVVSRASGRPVLPFSMPVRDHSGAVSGAVVATLDLGWFGPYLSRTKPLPPNASLALVDQDRMVVVGVPSRPGQSGSPAPEALSAPLGGEDPGLIELTGDDGVLRVVAYSPFARGAGGLGAWVGIDKAAALGPVDLALARSLLVLALTVAASAATALWLGKRHLQAPVEHLVGAARRLGEGDLGARAEMRSGDLAPLAAEFNRMAEGLGGRAARLRLLADLSSMLLTAADPDDAVARLVADAPPGLGLDLVFSYAADEGARALRLTREHGLAPEIAATIRTLPYGRLQCGRVAERREAFVAADVQRSGGPELAAAREVGLRAYAGFPLLGADGALLGVLAFGSRSRDAFGDADLDLLATVARHVAAVRERLRASSALAAAEERHRLALAATEDVVWDADLVADRSHPSEAVHKLLGYTAAAEGFSGDWWAARVHPGDRARVVGGLHDLLDGTGSRWEAEYRFARADGTYADVHDRGQVIRDGAGRAVRMVGAMHDLTEVRRHERELRAAKEEAERADLAKSKFLAAASHDLRQPMQSAILFAGALERHVRGGAGEEVLAHVRLSLDTLKGLMDALLDVSRLDAGLVEAKLEDVPLRDLVGFIAASYRPLAVGRGLGFAVTGCGAATARSDPVLLGRMVRNLVENALRYTERGTVEVACVPAGERVRLEVRDTGIGIPPEHLGRIFEEFHQVGNPERDRQQGLGLGLAIVRRIADLLGHRVEVRSEPGKGSIFSLEMELGAAVAAGATDPPAPAADPVEGRGRLALLVDDDAIVLMALRAILAEWGFEVMTAGSADQALDCLRQRGRRPDIVISDYRLRDGRVGTEVVARVRGLFGESIPGVILTGETGAECHADAAAHGLRIVHKPVTPHQLGKVVERQLGPTTPA